MIVTDFREAQSRELNVAPVRSSSVGDLLILNENCGDRLPGRSPNVQWTAKEEGESWRLLEQPAVYGWKGFPLTTAARGNWRFWLLGELYGKPGSRLIASDFLAEVADGNWSPEELNGHFLLVGWDNHSRRWHAWTSRFGTLHAYYATDGKRAALGTFSPAVAAAASRRLLDWNGITGFFACGFFPADKTFFNDQKILRPATHYIWDEQLRPISEDRYWNWSHQPNRTRSYNDTVGEFGHILHEVMSEQYDGTSRIALPISGGLDSRTTVAALTCLQDGYQAEESALPLRRPDVWAYSYGYTSNSIETNIARRIASAVGLDFQSFEIEEYLFERLAHVVSSVEGFQDATQCRQASIWEALGEKADRVIAAHWGDVWLDDMGLTGKDASEANEGNVLDHALGKMMKGGREWLLANICEPQLSGEDPTELLKSFTREQMQHLTHLEDPDFRIKAFKTDHWSFRWTTASLRMFQPGSFPRLPFYDTRLTDFFSSVPTDYLCGRRLQIDYLKRFSPALAKVTWQAFDANLYHYRYQNSWLLPKRAAKKAWRTLARRHVKERNWEVQFLSRKGRAALEDRLLRPGQRLHEYISLAAVKTLLGDFYTDPFAEKRGYTISMLLTFGIWLELYG
jgi:hypothetical protein